MASIKMIGMTGMTGMTGSPGIGIDSIYDDKYPDDEYEIRIVDGQLVVKAKNISAIERSRNRKIDNIIDGEI